MGRNNGKFIIWVVFWIFFNFQSGFSESPDYPNWDAYNLSVIGADNANEITAEIIKGEQNLEISGRLPVGESNLSNFYHRTFIQVTGAITAKIDKQNLSENASMGFMVRSDLTEESDWIKLLVAGNGEISVHRKISNQDSVLLVGNLLDDNQELFIQMAFESGVVHFKIANPMAEQPNWITLPISFPVIEQII